jgi:hypothetical protein
MTNEKELLSAALQEAMSREELGRSETAKLLNLNPCYVSMACRQNQWPSMGKTPWIRIAEWASTRMPLKAFVIPEGEPIYETGKKSAEKKEASDEKKSAPFTSAVLITEQKPTTARDNVSATAAGVPLSVMNDIDTIIEKTSKIREAPNNTTQTINNKHQVSASVAGKIETLELKNAGEMIKLSFVFDIRILVNGNPVS